METGGGVAILKKVVREGFKEEVNWSRALKVKGASHRDIQKTRFQKKRMASAKALRPGHAWYMWGQCRVSREKGKMLPRW